MSSRVCAATLIALAIVGPAHGQSMTVPSVLPPPQFDKPFAGTLILSRQATEAEMRTVCPSSANLVGRDGGLTIACSLRLQEGKGCLIVIVNDGVLASYGLAFETVYRHELGHCNGWGADHAGAIIRRPELALVR
jgi:hypothetical protein